MTLVNNTCRNGYAGMNPFGYLVQSAAKPMWKKYVTRVSNTRGTRNSRTMSLTQIVNTAVLVSKDVSLKAAQTYDGSPWAYSGTELFSFLYRVSTSDISAENTSGVFADLRADYNEIGFRCRG